MQILWLCSIHNRYHRTMWPSSTSLVITDGIVTVWWHILPSRLGNMYSLHVKEESLFSGISGKTDMSSLKRDVEGDIMVVLGPSYLCCIVILVRNYAWKTLLGSVICFFELGNMSWVFKDISPSSKKHITEPNKVFQAQFLTNMTLQQRYDGSKITIISLSTSSSRLPLFALLV